MIVNCYLASVSVNNILPLSSVYQISPDIHCHLPEKSRSSTAGNNGAPTSVPLSLGHALYIKENMELRYMLFWGCLCVQQHQTLCKHKTVHLLVNYYTMSCPILSILLTDQAQESSCVGGRTITCGYLQKKKRDMRFGREHQRFPK